MTFTQAKITPGLRTQHDLLYARWQEAVYRIERSTNPTDRMTADEERTYTELCDWVEQENLVYTELDPRGPDEDPWVES